MTELQQQLRAQKVNIVLSHTTAAPLMEWKTHVGLNMPFATRGNLPIQLITHTAITTQLMALPVRSLFFRSDEKLRKASQRFDPSIIPLSLIRAGPAFLAIFNYSQGWNGRLISHLTFSSKNGRETVDQFDWLNCISYIIVQQPEFQPKQDCWQNWVEVVFQRPSRRPI